MTLPVVVSRYSEISGKPKGLRALFCAFWALQKRATGADFRARHKSFRIIESGTDIHRLAQTSTPRAQKQASLIMFYPIQRTFARSSPPVGG